MHDFLFKLKNANSFIDHAAPKVQDSIKYHITNVVERRIYYKKASHDIFLS